MTDTVLDGDCRIVTFANGTVVRERIITVDDDAHRVVYSVLDEGITHHQGAMQRVTDDAGGTRMIWTADFLPAALAERLEPMMKVGAEVMRRTLQQMAPTSSSA